MPGELKLTEDMKRTLGATRVDPAPAQPMPVQPAPMHPGGMHAASMPSPQGHPAQAHVGHSYPGAAHPAYGHAAPGHPGLADPRNPSFAPPSQSLDPAFSQASNGQVPTGHAPAQGAAQPVTPPQQAPQPSITTDFITEKEHPICPMPFSVRVGEDTLEGAGISLTHAYVKVPALPDDGMLGTKHLARIQFQFDGFQINLTPEVLIARGRDSDEIALQFADPTGPHLPQLRYVINSFIAGDFVSLGSFLSYTGPVTPKAAKAKGAALKRNYVKSAGVILVSLLLIATAINIVTQRYIHAYEPRPVFIAQAGNDMRSTSPGQITYLNPDAAEGDVIYSISANSGDILNFQLPCDCTVQLADGVYEGATVLPSDPILTFHARGETRVQVESMISVEGLSRAVNGENVSIVLSDGRVVPVRVVQSSATNAAAQKGDIYLPVSLVAPPGLITADDIGKPARVRLTRTLPFLKFLKKDAPA